MNYRKFLVGVLVAVVLVFLWSAWQYSILKKESTFNLMIYSVIPSSEWHFETPLPFPFRSQLALREFKNRPLGAFPNKYMAGDGLQAALYLSYDIAPFRASPERARKIGYQLADNLLEKGVDINAVENECTALQSVIMGQSQEAVFYLLEKGASWDAPESTKSKWCALSAGELMDKFMPEIKEKAEKYRVQ